MESDSLQNENRQLKRAVEELSFLNELSGAIGSLFNSEEIMQVIIRKSIRAINAEQGAIHLVDSEADLEMETLVRSMVSTVPDRRPLGPAQSLLGWILINKKPLNITDPGGDERFSGVQWDESIRSVACVPLTVKAKLIGILSVYNKKTGAAFTDADLRLLSIIASQSAQVVENARLYEEEQAFIKLREETRLAREIQLNLLPEAAPEVPGYLIAGESIPALEVGGDYYDFIGMKGNRLAVCLGDISGKGLPAALLMSNLQATIRSQTPVGDSPQDCVWHSNRLLFHSTDTEKFATFFYGLLHLDTNEFHYTNAGHNPPLFFHGDSDPQPLSPNGPVMGFLADVEYSQAMVQFQPGDLCLIYSDGVTEAQDREDEEFGETKLMELMKENLELPPDEIIGKVLAAVREHARGAPQFDDITLVIIKRI
jgi:sigma-B regulation protein RsbU (phosphoserine phosphatase)